MVYNSNAKAKVLYLWKILQEETDAKHGLTTPQLIEKLAEYGISSERKSIYSDIKVLEGFGIEIKRYQRNPAEYAIERNCFNLEELMLLVDAVQSCRAITSRQADMLTRNIKQLASNHEQELLERHIHVKGRIKSKSESVLSLVDSIHEAIRLRCRIEFSYRKIGVDGKPRETQEGRKHEVTPVDVSYDDGFYYLTAWSERHSSMADYRLDRMARVCVLHDVPASRNSEISQYRRDGSQAVMFGRFAGPEVKATLAVDPDKVEIITDRFGSKTSFLSSNGSEALALVKVCKSEQFFGWVAGMGKALRIVEPASLVKEYKSYLQSLLED